MSQARHRHIATNIVSSLSGIPRPDIRKSYSSHPPGVTRTHFCTPGPDAQPLCGAMRFQIAGILFKTLEPRLATREVEHFQQDLAAQRHGETALKTPATVLLIRRCLYSGVFGMDGPPRTLTKSPNFSTNQGFSSVEGWCDKFRIRRQTKPKSWPETASEQLDSIGRD